MFKTTINNKEFVFDTLDQLQIFMKSNVYAVNYLLERFDFPFIIYFDADNLFYINYIIKETNDKILTNQTTVNKESFLGIIASSGFHNSEIYSQLVKDIRTADRMLDNYRELGATFSKESLFVPIENFCAQYATLEKALMYLNIGY